MNGSRKRKRRAYVARKDCVACGCCVKVCPLQAVRVVKGITAQIEEDNLSCHFQ